MAPATSVLAAPEDVVQVAAQPPAVLLGNGDEPLVAALPVLGAGHRVRGRASSVVIGSVGVLGSRLTADFDDRGDGPRCSRPPPFTSRAVSGRGR
jgi:hypothetical protein